MEILLFCIEVAQYQKYIKPQLQLDESNPLDMTPIEYQNVPNSEFLDHSNADVGIVEVAKIRANKLFFKYIEDGTAFEINISGIMRDALTLKLSDLDGLISNESIDLDQMYAMFEESVQEMMTLQSISFERFRQTETFCDVKALLKNGTTANAHQKVQTLAV